MWTRITLSSLVVFTLVPRAFSAEVPTQTEALDLAKIVAQVTGKAGAAKAEALRDVLEGDAPAALLPARAVRPERGTMLWLVDRDAARLLRPETLQEACKSPGAP